MQHAFPLHLEVLSYRILEIQFKYLLKNYFPLSGVERSQNSTLNMQM